MGTIVTPTNGSEVILRTRIAYRVSNQKMGVGVPFRRQCDDRDRNARAWRANRTPWRPPIAPVTQNQSRGAPPIAGILR